MPPSAQDVVEECWRRGLLAYKLDQGQLAIHREMRASKRRLKTLRCSRRYGKTRLLLTDSFELAIRRPGGRINYAAQTVKVLREILLPMFNDIVRDCPSYLRPVFRESMGHIEFPNGSVIVLAGCDKEDSIERLRGPAAIANRVDEGGSIPRLKYLVEDILEPQLLTTGGDTFIASTPPKTTGHAFADYALRSEANGSGWHRTLFENKRVAPEVIEEWIAESAASAGMTVEDYKRSTQFRREYLAELIGDPEKLVLPEFTEERASEIVKTLPIPLYVDRYVAMDVGHREDWTGNLYASWLFESATLFIEGERLIRRMTTPALAQAVRDDEAQLWGLAKPYRRVSDIAPQVTADLAQLHGLIFQDTSKDDLDAAINQVRMAINGQRGRLAIHPRCVNLIRQMKQCTWNRARTEFERTEQNGHYDLVAALIYLVRNIHRAHNPYPTHMGENQAGVMNPRPVPAAVRSLRGGMNTRRILHGDPYGEDD